MQSALNSVDDSISDATVADYVQGNGEWDLASLTQLLLSDIINKIRACPTPVELDDSDGIAWKRSSHGNFRTRSAYEPLSPAIEDCTFWKCLWKWRGPLRISVFMWLAYHNSLRRSSWAGGSAHCAYCHGSIESVIHILRDSPVANSLWIHLVNTNKLVEFFSLDQNEWFEVCISQDMGDDSDLVWADLYIASRVGFSGNGGIKSCLNLGSHSPQSDGNCSKLCKRNFWYYCESGKER